MLQGITATIVSDYSDVQKWLSWPATVVHTPAGLSIAAADTGKQRISCPLSSKQVQSNAIWRAGPSSVMVQGRDLEKDQDVAVLLRTNSPEVADQLLALGSSSSSSHSQLQEEPDVGSGNTAAAAAAAAAAGAGKPGAGPAGAQAATAAATEQRGSDRNVFDAKMEKGSADLYFHYYGMLQHQQNMLQDYTRTGTYYCALLENSADIKGKVVMDVGAGSGILSLFAAQAGAAKVYAVEASGMAKYAQRLAASNSRYGQVVQVLHSKVEALELPEGEKVDVLVSEPMGTLLVNERMLETYLYARDHFLKPGGLMFPTLGRIHVAAFSDVGLYSELYHKGAFWQYDNFYGVDLRCLYSEAVAGYFTQVVVDAFEPSALVSDVKSRVLDFQTMKEEELYDMMLPLDLRIESPCTVHGIACWFDVLFQGSTTQRWLSTAPGMPTTHWFQLRCVLQQPLMVLQPNTQLSGELRLVAHERQSYDVHVHLVGPPLQPGMAPQRSKGKFDLKEPYYRQLTQWPTQQQQQQQQQQQDQAAGPEVGTAFGAGSGMLCTQQGLAVSGNAVPVVGSADKIPHMAANAGAAHGQAAAAMASSNGNGVYQ